jgi:hypothetical protein
MAFGKKSAGKTIAVVDVENGSVGAALVRLSRHEAPRLFAETRILLPLSRTHNVEALMRQTDEALERALIHVSEVASRMRTHETLGQNGEVARIAGFLSIPWAALSLDKTAPDIPQHIKDTFRSAVYATLGEQPMSLHPYGTAALHGISSLFPYEAPILLCVVSGEATELLLLADNTLKARATLPQGFNTLLRTLVAHGGMSPHEARSFVHLGSTAPQALVEPLTHAGEHFAQEFMDVAQEMIKVAPVGSVLVTAPEQAETWFARALGEAQSLEEVFPEGSTVRAVRSEHVQPYMAGHGSKPDLPLMLEALFVDNKFSRFA